MFAQVMPSLSKIATDDAEATIFILHLMLVVLMLLCYVLAVLLYFQYKRCQDLSAKYDREHQRGPGSK